MLTSVHWNNDDLVVLQSELTGLYRTTPAHIRAAVAKIVRQSSASLAQRFYNVLIDQPRARFYLDQTLVSERLRSALEKWLEDLFDARHADPEQMTRRQTEIGNVHARIQIPISLVMRGFRELKHGITEDIRRTRLSQDETVVAIHFISIMFDLAFSIMTAAYVVGSERAARSDEALRLFTAGQDLLTERERQRAALAEWAQTVFFNAQFSSDDGEILPLVQSDFGLWFIHRANLLFRRSPEYDSIVKAIDEIDKLVSTIAGEIGPAERQASLKSIKQTVDRIGARLSMLFERSQETESARDPLTRVFNRRFLLTLLSREIAIQKETRRPFSVIMLEVAGAAKMRMEHGEAEADQVIQQTATMLLNYARRSDSIFRMGQETFLIVRVEADAATATDFARSLASRYAATHFEIGGRTYLDNALAFAVAEFDGHPDPRHLVVRAEQELRQKTNPP